MKKKALFFDYDGTLISDETHTIPKSARKVLNKLKDKGYLLFLNTGRTKAILDPIISELDFDGQILGCGSYIEYHDKVLYDVDVDKQLYEAIIQKVAACHVDAFFEGTYALYMTHGIQSPRLLNLLERYHDANMVMKSVDDLEDDFVKMFVSYQDLDKEQEFHDFIIQNFEYIDRGQHCAELILKGHSKATGIQFIMDKLNIDIENCYVFGDSNNDLAMFRFVENSALLGNANEHLHEEVMHVCSDVDHDGLMEAVNAFQLL